MSINFKYGLTPIINEDIGYASSEESLNILNTSYQNAFGTDYIPGDFFTYKENGEIILTPELATSTSSNAFDAVTRLGSFYDANISVVGGGEHTSNYASVNYRKDKFSLEGAEKESIYARINSDYKKSNLTLGIQTSGKYTDNFDISDWDAMGRVMPFCRSTTAATQQVCGVLGWRVLVF